LYFFQIINVHFRETKFEYKNEIVFLKTKADQNIELAKQFGITQVPTLIVIKEIDSMERVLGLITENGLLIKLNELNLKK